MIFLVITFDSSWDHLSDLELADPEFGTPGRIDMLLGVNVFIEVLLHGQWVGPPSSPSAIETKLGWIIAGATDTQNTEVMSRHTEATSDDILKRFWEVEEPPNQVDSVYWSKKKCMVVDHFQTQHSHSSIERFVIPLPRRVNASTIGEFRSQVIRRFVYIERLLSSKGLSGQFNDVIREYFDMGHAEPVLESDFKKSAYQVFYLPIQIVQRDSSTTTKIRVVFDTFAKSSTRVSLNDTLLVAPMVHSPLIDFLLRFRSHRVALTTDVRQMYRAIELTESDRDYHRFVWRSHPNEPI